jgi:hypothetical protein
VIDENEQYMQVLRDVRQAAEERKKVDGNKELDKKAAIKHNKKTK